MADDFRLLLKAVTMERPAVLELVSVAAEGVAHERQIEAPARLRLPDVGQLMDEKALPMQRLAGEILRPEVRMRMEMNVAHRGHGDARRLERPPFAVDHPHPAVIDGVAED